MLGTKVKVFKWADYATDDELVTAIADFVINVSVLTSESVIARDPQTLIFYQDL